MINYKVNCPKGMTDILPVMVGRSRCTPDMSYGPRVRDHYIIHFCISGRGVLYKKGEEYNVEEGEMFIIRPGEETTYTADTKNPWYYTWISFVGERASVFDKGQCVRRIPGDIAIRLLDLVEAGETSADIFVSLLYNLIYDLYSVSSLPYDRLAELRRYIRYKMKMNASASEIAEMFNYERSYLHRKFKERYGITVKQYITEVRMTRAKNLLLAGYSVVETSYRTGYCNEFVFSKAFKKFYGTSPSTLKPKQMNKKELN